MPEFYVSRIGGDVKPEDPRTRDTMPGAEDDDTPPLTLQAKLQQLVDAARKDASGRVVVSADILAGLVADAKSWERMLEVAGQERNEEERSGAVRPLRSDDPPGTTVMVVQDDRTLVLTRTRSETWTVGDARDLVLLESRSGGFLAERCFVLESK